MKVYIDRHKKREPTYVHPNDTCLMTIHDGQDIQLITPRGEGMMGSAATLLCAFLFRIKEDPEWVEDMNRYIEEYWPELH